MGIGIPQMWGPYSQQIQGFQPAKQHDSAISAVVSCLSYPEVDQMSQKKPDS